MAGNFTTKKWNPKVLNHFAVPMLLPSDIADAEVVVVGV